MFGKTGYYQGPPVMAPPQYPQQYQYAQPPPPQQPVQKERGFLEGWYVSSIMAFDFYFFSSYVYIWFIRYHETLIINLSFWFIEFFNMVSNASVTGVIDTNLNHLTFKVKYLVPCMRGICAACLHPYF